MSPYKLLLILAGAGALCADSGTFDLLGTYRGLGAMVASSVGPGPGGSERLYASYLYLNTTIDVVAIDPDSGAFDVFANPAPGEYGARSMVLGPDGKIYLGTLPGAHLLCLDPQAGTFTDLGRPSKTEQYIWDLAVGPDGKIYGATYPQSKLVRYDPASGVLEDLGRMDPVEQYAHYVAGSDDGFVYTGIGTSKANIAAYEVATGLSREILPADYQIVAQAVVYRGVDGRVYGYAGARWFRMEGWTAIPIGAGEAAARVPNNRLQDGRTVALSGNTVTVTDPETGETAPQTFDYQGNTLPLFRVGLGPDGALYGSAVLPIHFVKLDQDTGQVSELGDLGGGEIYSFLAHGGRLLMAGYSSIAPLMSFDPSQPFQVGGDASNPSLVHFYAEDSGWRPQAMIEGPDGRVYVGAVSGYGKLGGGMTIWDTAGDLIENYQQLVTDESVVSLAPFGSWIVGGTTVSGGGGSHPTQKNAKLFVWDIQERRKILEFIPSSGATDITDLVAAPDGLVYGIAASNRLFGFDPAYGYLAYAKILPFSGPIYNSAAVGPDGRIWGLIAAGVFSFDPATKSAVLEARSPEPVTAGFAMDAKGIYFASGASIYRYNFPQPE